MTEELVIEIVQRGVLTALYLAAPILLLSLLAGFLVSLFQAVTQINEPTLTFLPKMLAAALAIFLFFPWMLSVIVNFSTNLITNIPTYIR
jgi:flagellar biosynthetic protein FliQ